MFFIGKIKYYKIAWCSRIDSMSNKIANRAAYPKAFCEFYSEIPLSISFNHIESKLLLVKFKKNNNYENIS